MARWIGNSGKKYLKGLIFNKQSSYSVKRLLFVGGCFFRVSQREITYYYYYYYYQFLKGKIKNHYVYKLKLSNYFMRMLCYKCDHSWNYKGNSEGKVYVTCPNCIRKVRIDKALIEESFQQKLLTELPISKGKIPTTTSFSKEKILLPVKKPKLVEIKETIMEDVEEEKVEPLEIFIDGKACELHSLPATYDSLDRKWVCEKCLEFETPNAKPYEKNLGIVIYIQKEKSIKIIPRDPIALLRHQEEYGLNIVN